CASATGFVALRRRGPTREPQRARKYSASRDVCKARAARSSGSGVDELQKATLADLEHLIDKLGPRHLEGVGVDRLAAEPDPALLDQPAGLARAELEAGTDQLRQQDRPGHAPGVRADVPLGDVLGDAAIDEDAVEGILRPLPRAGAVEAVDDLSPERALGLVR